MICFQAGLQSFNEDPYWPYGNVCDVTFEYAYVLDEGETELPRWYAAAWEEGVKVREILDENILPGRTALRTLEVLEEKLTEAGYLFLTEQDYVWGDHRVQVPVDMHAAGKGYYAPRLGYLGPDWQREMVLPLNHHFFNEYWVYSHVVSCHDVAAIWAAFFSKMPAISLLNSRNGARTSTARCSSTTAPLQARRARTTPRPTRRLTASGCCPEECISSHKSGLLSRLRTDLLC